MIKLRKISLGMHQINKNFSKIDSVLISILFLFSFSINWHYAQYGVFPIDSFYHFDSGYRITRGEFPVRDYWVTTGILVDFMQAFFFNLFGTKWSSYILHSSIFNALITISTYIFFIKFGLDKKISFIYSCMFGVLAYTPSATPFVDQHATFFLLIGTFCFVLGIKKQKKLYWIVTPWFFGFSFLCKQVPVSYMTLCVVFISFAYAITMRKNFFLLSLLLSSILFSIFIFLMIFLLDIGLKDFFIQYILYPPSIAEGRFDEYKITIKSFYNNYKFILLPLILIVFLNLKNIFSERKNIRHFFSILTIVAFTGSLIFHQILTKNQIYIFFLSPLLFGFLSAEIITRDYKLKNVYLLFFIIISILITFKYHDRLNEKRKFHELINVNMKDSLESSLIHKKLSGFKWITNEYKENVQQEIDMLKNYLNILSSEKRNKMVITHYLFLSSLLEEDLNAPSRSFTVDGASFPTIKNKYYNDYRRFFNNKLKNKKIEIIYILDKYIDDKAVINYLDKSCIIDFSKTENMNIYEIKKNCIN